MSTVLFWFRNDLRLHDQSALHAACQLGAQQLLPVVCLPDVQAATAWGFARIGPHRRAWLAAIRNPTSPCCASTPPTLTLHSAPARKTAAHRAR